MTEVILPETPDVPLYSDAAIDDAAEDADEDDTEDTPDDDSPVAQWLAAEQEWRDSFIWFDPTENWPHSWLEFRGDRLAVRTPKTSALSSYSIATSEGSSPARRNKYTRQLLERHMSPATYERVMDRMGDPDDEGYDEPEISELMTHIVQLRTGPIPAPNRAERRHPTT